MLLILGIGIVGSADNCVFNILRNCQTISATAAPRSHRAGSGHGFWIPRPCPHVLLSVSLSTVIPAGLKWCLITAEHFLCFLAFTHHKESHELGTIMIFIF